MGIWDWLSNLFGGESSSSGGSAGQPRPISPADLARVRQLLADGQRIAAISAYRQATNQSLTVSMQEVDRLAGREPVAPAASSSGLPLGRVGTPSAQQPPVQPPAQPRPPSLVSRLDAGPFAPLSDADVKAKAKTVGSLWGNPWFGRRDLIPPVSDPRTLLIDQAMVGHGYLTPEQLVEIHKVGEEMDQVRPDLALAAERTKATLAQSEEEKARLKAQKKAEAAERKKQRAEAVAQRRLTDIVFLGRGVSKGLADRRANVEKLTAAGLPVLASPADVAKALGLTVPRLRWLAFHSEAATRTHYVRFEVKKKSGGVRTLAAPHRTMAAAQAWILRNILDKVPVHAAAHGFVAKRSTVTNAQPHVGRAAVLNADLKDFFPSITFVRVKGIFQELGYSPAVATVLGLICTESPRHTANYAGTTYHVAIGPRALPQGACTSPALSNLASRRMDARFAGLARKLDWVYTRYADDLTFSAQTAAAPLAGYVLARIRHIAEAEGFVVNEKKTRLQRRNTAQSVTGVIVNDRPGVSRKVVRRLRAILHRARREGLAAQNRTGRPNFEAWLRGMIAYISMVQPQQGQKLAAQLAALSSR